MRQRVVVVPIVNGEVNIPDYAMVVGYNMINGTEEEIIYLVPLEAEE